MNKEFRDMGGTHYRVPVGKCGCCGSRIYKTSEHPNGQNATDPDPRWVFGPKAACNSLEAREYNMAGDDFLICFDCANTRETYERSLVLARKSWK
jgi:hypothetical protein